MDRSQPEYEPDNDPDAEELVFDSEKANEVRT